jgi:selenocysteine-specific translation elongation factor
MGNLNIAVLGHPEYGAQVGKKGTTSDITLYNVKREENTLTLLEPARYPDRLSSLFYSVSLADMAVLVVDDITSQFGEMILMLHAAGVEKGFLVLRPHIDLDQVKRLIRGTVVEHYQFVKDNPIALREILLEEAGNRSSLPPPEQGRREACSVAVDHFFPVKGIGVVVLGGVIKGTLLKHDILTVLPKGLSAQVRSIQKHDDDVTWAGEGDRVGLALKNIALEDLDRGDVLTNDTSLSTTSTLSSEATLLPFWQQPIKAGMVVHIGHWMQFIPSRVLSAEPGLTDHTYLLCLAMEKPLVHPPGNSAVLCFLDGKKLRVMGTIRLPEYRKLERSPVLD